MFCVQETESHADPFSNDKDPLSTNQSESSDDEPSAKRLKTFSSPSLNLKVYQIPAFNTPKSLSIFPSTPTTALPKFVNNPLNLANPLALAANNANNVVKSLHTRYSLPAKLTITPVQTPPKTDNGEIVRYKKNGEIAKKRGPPKGYKRKPKADLSCSFTNGALLQAQNTILTSLLAANPGLSSSLASLATLLPSTSAPVPQIQKVVVPEGTELVELDLDPEDWFPTEPYKMVFSRKKNPKWKNFPYRCEHCFKGYRVASTLIQHAAERHGSVPKELAIPCPCCPHVSTRRKLHKKHLETHESRKHRIFCLYCLPPLCLCSVPKELAIPCPCCPHVSTRRKLHKKHLETHESRKHRIFCLYCLPPKLAIPCPCCPHVSTRRKLHKKHLETHESRKHRIFCLYCLPPTDPNEPYVKESEKYPFDKFPQYWYASEESLRLHKKRKHPEAAMFNYNWFATWADYTPNS